jgi:Ca2+-binding RTX toxin-like protein
MEEPMPLIRTATLATATTAPTYTLVKTVTLLPLGPNEINGTDAADYLQGTSGDDFIHGNAGNDSLYGLAGNDILDGGAGADVMAGGVGDDTYYVDDVNDVVWEWGGEGIDTVRASINNAVYVLPVAVENVELIGTAASGAQGNELDNVMTGNDVYNVLYGGAGNDTLYGAGGNDSLYGDVGNDVLDGGTGGDLMQGGQGDDIYYVDSYSDKIYEAANYGIDTVRSKIAYVLDENIENLELAASATNAYATGNALNNVIHGNATNNVITGGAGFDTMFGGAGADTFKFAAVGEAAPLGAGYTDYIPDFNEAEGDKIDLSAIDANLFVAGDQAFNPIGVNVAFTGAAGQLRFNYGFLEGDVNGDAVADFQIDLDVAGLSAGALVL